MSFYNNVLKYLKECKVALADRFAPYFTMGVCNHIVNLENQKREFYTEHGRVANLRTHVFMCAPPGFTKTLYLEKFLKGKTSIVGGSAHVNCGFEGSMCLPAGQLIRMADGSELPVEQVHTSQEVVCVDENMKVAKGKVSNTFKMRGLVLEILLEDGTKIQVTDNHPLMTYQGWLPAGKLGIRFPVAKIRRDKIHWCDVKGIKEIGVMDVYNLSVDKYHNFLVSDVVTHNTEAGFSVCSNSPVLIKKKGLIDIISIEELFRKEPVSSYEEKEISDIDIMSNGNWTKLNKVIRHKWTGNLQRVFCRGGMVEVTPSHSLFNADGDIVKGSDVKEGDELRVNAVRKVDDASLEMDEELAWLLGLFCAEGSRFKTGQMIICNGDKALIETCKDILDDLGSKTSRYQGFKPINLVWRGDVWSVTITKNLRHLFQVCYTKNGRKKVPKSILNGTEWVKKSFIEGFHMGDGIKNNIHGATFRYQGFAQQDRDRPLAAGMVYLISTVYGQRATIFPMADTGKRKNRKAGDRPRVEGKYVNVRFNSPDSRWSGSLRKPLNEVKGVFERPVVDEYVYDVSTESECFDVGENWISCHNTGTVKVVNGEPVEVKGAAYENRMSIMGIDEFASLTNAMRQEHSINLDNAMLTALDSGFLIKRLALGKIQYITQLTLFTGSQPMRFNLTSGLGRRFIYIWFIPTRDEEQEIRESRRLAKSYISDLSIINDIKMDIKKIYMDCETLKKIKFDDSIYKFFDKIHIPHFEETLYERMAIGYTLAKDNGTDGTMQISLDSTLKRLFTRANDWRLEIKKGAETSQVYQVVKEMTGSTVSQVKRRLTDLGLAYSQSTNILNILEKQGRIRYVREAVKGKGGRPRTLVIASEN